ncbi:DUF6879 family protein [Embleya sp. NPDC020886]|uniref:DUF6879 family protein n=1 Tax=Embleya sp. NPDC020886 TaxID=3363980 RepID=UPI0037B3CE88
MESSSRTSCALPSGDFWLFDSRILGRFHFDGDRSLGMELTDHPTDVLIGCQVRDAAWHFALPYDTFHTRVPSRP